MLKFFQEFITKQYETFNSSSQDIETFKRYLADPHTSEIPKSLVSLPLFLPQLLEELANFIRETDNVELKSLAGGLYTYVFNPYDYIGDEEIAAPLGLIDDALIVFYGMELIEERVSYKRFSTLQNPELSEAVTQVEKLLAADLVTALKAYPKQVFGILSTTNFDAIKTT